MYEYERIKISELLGSCDLATSDDGETGSVQRCRRPSIDAYNYGASVYM
jgi:hypothetical protein